MLQHLLVWSVATAWSLCDIMQLLCVDFHTTGASSALQFYIFPLEKALCNFWPSPFFPQWYIWSVVWAFCIGLQFSFWQLHQRQARNSETPMGFHQTHIYFWSRLLIHKFVHRLCNIDIIGFFLRLFAYCWHLTDGILMQSLSRPMSYMASSSFCKHWCKDDCALFLGWHFRARSIIYDNRLLTSIDLAPWLL